MKLLRPEKKLVEAEALDLEKISSLSDQTRLEIFERLAERPSYPSEMGEQLGIGKQRAYYHFRKLEEAGLVEKGREEKKSGGVAKFYRPSSDSYYFDLGTGGEEVFFPEKTPEVEEFLDPLVSAADMNGIIVVGSPDQHGEDQVRARDGHLAGEVGLKLGGYCDAAGTRIRLDTEVVKEGLLDETLLVIGGVLTNTIAKKFNGDFPVSFSLEDFPYHKLETPEGEYSDPEIGVVAKTDHPGTEQESLYLVAGVRNRGTRAAVIAFKELEKVVEGYSGGNFYRVVRGLDLDGDGEIDDFEVLE